MGEQVDTLLSRLKEMTKELSSRDTELLKLCKKHKHFVALMKALCDSLPILVWAKDVNEKYLFANKLCCEWLLNTDTEEVIGKDDMFFADRERLGRSKDYHTYGETCHKSDQLVLNEGRSLHAIEDGYVKGEAVSIEVFKVPFLENGEKFIGVVGCAFIRDKRSKIDLS